jgi:nitrile hydratase accessory protein
MTSHRVPPRHPAMPPIPQDGDGPVFREPWEAQAFAMVLELFDRGHFTWREWVRALSAEIAAARERGEPDLGGTYYRHWLSALEKIVTVKRLTSTEELALRKEQWAEADHDRGFGEPIVIRPSSSETAPGARQQGAKA